MQRRLVLWLLFVSAIMASAGCSSTIKSSMRSSRKPLAFAKWKKFEAPDKSFSVSFPGAPKVVPTQPKPNAKIDEFKSKAKSEQYNVYVSTAKDDAAAFGRDDDAGLVKKYADIFGKTQKESKLGGEPATEVTWDENSRHNRALILKTHQGLHLFIVAASWTESKEPANVQKFFDSFAMGPYTAKTKPSATPTPDAEPTASATPEPDISKTPEPEETGSEENSEE